MAIVEPIAEIIGDYRAFAAQQRDRPSWKRPLPR
jgi:hypothetical protein